MASNKNNNKNAYTRHDGTVNCDNPRVCAALTDAIGMMLVRVFHDLKSNPDLLAAIPDETKADLDTVMQTMQLIRNNIGVDTDWYNENQSDLVPEIMAEAHTKREAFKTSLADAMLAAGLPIDMIPPDLRPKASPADAADAILESLRSDGVIG